MADSRSVTATLTMTIEVDWPHTFGEDATAADIYTTAARECRNIVEQALVDGKVRFRIIGEPEAKMVVYPVKKP